MADSRSDEAASAAVGSVSFSILSAEDIRKTSVKKITKSDVLDANDRPVVDGLYDAALGPINNTDICKSCGLYSFRCPGHCGHIDFALPIYNPLLFRTLCSLLQNTCFFCHKFKLKHQKVQRYGDQLELILKGDVIRSLRLPSSSISLFNDEEEGNDVPFDDPCFISHNSKQKDWTSLQYAEAHSVLSRFMREKSKKCNNCGKKNPTIKFPTFGWLKMEMSDSDIRSNLLGGSSLSELDIKYAKQKNSTTGDLIPTTVRDILKRLWENELRICSLIFNIQRESISSATNENGYNMFFMEALLVPPNKFRPPSIGNKRGDI